MTAREFINRLANGKIDIFQITLDILSKANADYCLIGGIAVNAYAEPVVSLDFDLVVVSEKIDEICRTAKNEKLKIRRFEHSINFSSSQSALIIQIQMDARYQEFVQRSVMKDVFGYHVKVASIEDVLQGKIWAYSDSARRKSKRQKDLADITRLLESHPFLKKQIPKEIMERID